MWCFIIVFFMAFFMAGLTSIVLFIIAFFMALFMAVLTFIVLFTIVFFMVIFIACFLTEVISNMAMVSIFGPIIVSTAVVKGYDPVLMLLGVTLASSFAFMLPMAGGPNMTVYATGKVSVTFMAKHGFALNLTAVAFGTVYMFYVMPSFLGRYAGLIPVTSPPSESLLI